jgi:hypothetical protein
MVDGLNHELSKPLPLNLDQRQVLRQVRDQLGRIQESVKVWCVENQLPMELLLEFLPQACEVQMNE